MKGGLRKRCFKFEKFLKIIDIVGIDLLDVIAEYSSHKLNVENISPPHGIFFDQSNDPGKQIGWLRNERYTRQIQDALDIG